MADVSDVEDAFVALIAGVIYPNGAPSLSPTGSAPGPLPASPVLGAPCNIYRGWPTDASLNADMNAGAAEISVFPLPNGTRLTTRYEAAWTVTVPAVVVLTVSVSGASVTFAGPSPLALAQVAGVQIGETVYAAQFGAADTPATVATKFAALIPNATAAGAVLTIATNQPVIARTGGVATAQLEQRRQEQAFRVTIWAPTPALRDRAASLVDAALAGTQWIYMADGTAGHLLYRGSATDDVTAKTNTWQRTLSYHVEYPTVLTQQQPEMLFGGGTLTDLAFTTDFGPQLAA